MPTIPERYLKLTIVYDNTTVDIDLSQYVASITTSYQRRATRTMTAIDGTEWAYPMPRKRGVKVTFKPMSGAALQDLYDFLDSAPWVVWYRVQYRDPTDAGDVVTVDEMRIANEWETKYLLKSIDTNRYYSGLTLELRER